MPVITIAQSKGGAGKTTLALALTSEFESLGGSVFVLDADRQNSLLNWHRDRLAAGRGGHTNIQVEDASQLRDADRRVRELTGLTDDGKPILKEFQHVATIEKSQRNG